MLLACLAIVLLSCALALPLTHRLGRNSGWVLAAPLLVAAGLLVAVAEPAGPVDEVWPWMPTLGVDFALRLDGLSLLFSLLVLVIGAGVLIYSTRYLGSNGRHGSFYLLMTVFALAMLLLVLTDNLVVLFVAWEATTLCSFFLIARPGPHARESAIRTLLVTAAGGLALLAAVVVVAVGTGTTRISAALADPIWHENAGFVVAVAALVAAAAFTKSAQFPFQAWLPDSMVAITPVSAYLHAAAMVKAGIYLLLRFSPALAGEQVWSLLLISAGLITALFGAVAALRRYDLKELLAFSTVSQLGLLVAMIGVGTPAALTAALVHTVAHALFKSALFMLVGVIDLQAGTRDIRKLADLRLRMPVTAVSLALAATSMAGVPLLLGFISKELMLDAFFEMPGPAWVSALVVAGGVLTSVFTFAYSGRIVLGALAGRSGRLVPEGAPAFLAVPAIAAAAGLAFGVVPFPLDSWISSAATATIGQEESVYLTLWHGLTPALAASVVVMLVGTALVLARHRVQAVMAPLALPISGLAVVDRLRAGTISLGVVVGGWAGSRSPRLHLAIPPVCLALFALIGVFVLRDLPPVVGEPSRPTDWVLVALVVVGTLGAVLARTRIAAIVVLGVVGFTMTLWYFALGAADVAITQLLVEILTVCVMVLLLRRLPLRFQREKKRPRIVAAVVAVGAGVATTLGVWAFTGRREMSEAAAYYLREGEELTGGANIVNTILVDFRALDTLGELTVLGVAGIAMAVLLHGRRPAPTRSAHLDTSTPLADAAVNSVFVRSITRLLGPVIIALSMILLLRGHQEPGGGFNAALIGGAGFALLYLAAPSDTSARVKWPYMVLIGAGVAIATATGFLGYADGSFLRPLHAELFGMKLTSALVFDVGVYLAVIGVVLAAFNLLGRQRRVVHDDEPTMIKEVSHR